MTPADSVISVGDGVKFSSWGCKLSLTGEDVFPGTNLGVEFSSVPEKVAFKITPGSYNTIKYRDDGAGSYQAYNAIEGIVYAYSALPMYIDVLLEGAGDPAQYAIVFVYPEPPATP